MNVVINKTKLISSKVSLVNSKTNKSLKYNNYYYNFTKNSNEYPLELAIKQIKELESFEVIIIPDEKEEGYCFIFNKTPLRKTIFVENQSFLRQLVKFKEIFNSVVILNDSRLTEEGIYKENPQIFENINFLAIEKLPDLIDIRKRRALVRNYLIYTICLLLSILSFNIYQNKLIEEVEMVKDEVSMISNRINGLNEQTITIEDKNLPSKEEQINELNEVFKKITEGRL